MTKPSAGNTGRHEDSILWDRLRADLNNLGAAYGALPEIRDEDLEPAQSVAVEMVVCECCFGTGGWHAWRCDHGPHPASLYPDKPDYDAILLAARKKREALAWMDEPLTDDERDICHQMWDEQERAEKVSRAMDRPLSFPKRIGWKPGGGGE